MGALPLALSHTRTKHAALIASNYSSSSSTFIHVLSGLPESEFVTVTHPGKVLLLTEGDTDGGRGRTSEDR